MIYLSIITGFLVFVVVRWYDVKIAVMLMLLLLFYCLLVGGSTIIFIIQLILYLLGNKYFLIYRSLQEYCRRTDERTASEDEAFLFDISLGHSDLLMNIIFECLHFLLVAHHPLVNTTVSHYTSACLKEGGTVNIG